jgi:hypothetical protein
MVINDVFDSLIIIWQAKPYVFKAFVFHDLLDQKFFETYGTYVGVWCMFPCFK